MNPKTVRVVDDIAPQGARAELDLLGVAFPDRAEKFPDTSDLTSVLSHKYLAVRTIPCFLARWCRLRRGDGLEICGWDRVGRGRAV